MDQENKTDNIFKRIISKLSPPAKVMAVIWTLSSLLMITSETHTFIQKFVVILFGYIFYCGIANLIYKTISRNSIRKSNENDFDKIEKGNDLEIKNYNNSYSEPFECDELIASQYLKILHDSVNIFNNTKNPDTFFERYALAEEQAEKLCCLKNIKYTMQSPVEIRQQLIDKKQSAIYNMIDRYFDSTELKASKVKSVSKKIECFSMFITVLEEYYDLMNKENIQYVETLYNNATSYFLDNKKTVSNKITSDNKLSTHEKELILVQNVTTEDMLSLTNMPFVWNVEVKKFIKDRGHPFAYMDISGENIEIVKSELEKINSIIKLEIKKNRSIPSNAIIPIDKIVFRKVENYGYSRIICTPKTLKGNPTKYPLHILFMTDFNVKSASTHGEIYYGQDGKIKKGKVYCWRKNEKYFYYFDTIDGELKLVDLDDTKPIQFY